MKNLYRVFFILAVCSCGAPVLGQSAVSDNKLSVSPPPKSSFFIKTSAGSFIYQIIFTAYYNRSSGLNGLSDASNEYVAGITGFAASVAGGIDFPDHFSLFLSSEWLGKNWPILANAQWALFRSNLLKPYIFSGLGVDFNGAALGPAGQLGFGTDVVMTKDFDLFAETKFFIPFIFYRDDLDELQSFYRSELLIPIEFGVKLNL